MTTETTPELLVPGDVILGARDGKEWTVAEKLDPPGLLLERGEKEVRVLLHQLPPKVTLVSPAQRSHEAAVALAQVRLGGEVVGVKDGGPFSTPAHFQDPGQLLAHLYLFHMAATTKDSPAVYPEGPLAELLRIHDHEHGSSLVVPHRHVESFHADLAQPG